MVSPRRRAIWLAITVVIVGWVVAVAGFHIARNSRMTAEKVAAYLGSQDVSRLSGTERTRVLRELARKMNALSVDERRRARIMGPWEKWFGGMTDQEKVEFVEATLPSGFKQMLNSFEEMPEAKRRMAIDRAMAQLQRARDEAAQNTGAEGDGADMPGRRMEQLSPELQQRVVQIGLKSYYSQSSAQTKAELAPLMEEMQRMMESGMLFRGRRE